MSRGFHPAAKNSCRSAITECDILAHSITAITSRPNSLIEPASIWTSMAEMIVHFHDPGIFGSGTIQGSDSTETGKVPFFPFAIVKLKQFASVAGCFRCAQIKSRGCYRKKSNEQREGKKRSNSCFHCTWWVEKIKGREDFDSHPSQIFKQNRINQKEQKKSSFPLYRPVCLL